MSKAKNITLWGTWLLMSLALAGYLAYGLWGEEQADALYLPDAASHGHYQIELACDACHGDGFEDEDAMQAVCIDCHGDELKLANDSHPVKKFNDPRNAERLEILNARYCITCHVEHAPERTRVMGVTLADDFCVLCHQNVADERASHQDLPFDGCSAAGCHNYHDNRALYEDFLVKHADAEETVEAPLLPERDYQKVYQQQGNVAEEALLAADMDGGDNGNDVAIVDGWASSAHAATGVNCRGCHQSTWQAKPAMTVCEDCHEGEMAGFVAGRHGMRLPQTLSEMTPADARQPMRVDAYSAGLSCGSCHDVHRADTRYAAVEACQGCHDDEHSHNYTQSVHYQLWQKELEGSGAPNSGVSCASCHLPRIEMESRGEDLMRVQHNQNANLRPNEKMIREVCMACHSLRFSIDALADEALVKNNFNGKPSKHVESIDWAIGRVKKE